MIGFVGLGIVNVDAFILVLLILGVASFGVVRVGIIHNSMLNSALRVPPAVTQVDGLPPAAVKS